MPFEVNTGDDLTMQAAASVSAITKDANGNYSSGGIPQYAAVKLDASGAVPNDVVIATTGDIAFGIAQSGPATGTSQSMSVRTLGISKALAGAAIVVGVQVYVGDSSGRLKTVTAAGATGVVVVGLALTPATAAGDVFTVLIQPTTQAVTS